jgi:hypothetical protein
VCGRRETAVNRLKPHDPRLNWRGFGARRPVLVEDCRSRTCPNQHPRRCTEYRFANTFVDLERLGLRSPGELPLVTIAYLIAQKLHACTDHTDPERPNDRCIVQ